MRSKCIDEFLIFRKHSQGIFCLSPRFLQGGPLVPSGPILVPLQFFIFFVSRILRKLFNFEFLQIQILGGENCHCCHALPLPTKPAVRRRWRRQLGGVVAVAAWRRQQYGSGGGWQRRRQYGGGGGWQQPRKLGGSVVAAAAAWRVCSDCDSLAAATAAARRQRQQGGGSKVAVAEACGNGGGGG